MSNSNVVLAAQKDAVDIIGLMEISGLSQSTVLRVIERAKLPVLQEIKATDGRPKKLYDATAFKAFIQAEEARRVQKIESSASTTIANMTPEKHQVTVNELAEIEKISRVRAQQLVTEFGLKGIDMVQPSGQLAKVFNLADFERCKQQQQSNLHLAKVSNSAEKLVNKTSTDVLAHVIVQKVDDFVAEDDEASIDALIKIAIKGKVDLYKARLEAKSKALEAKEAENYVLRTQLDLLENEMTVEQYCIKILKQPKTPGQAGAVTRSLKAAGQVPLRQVTSPQSGLKAWVWRVEQLDQYFGI